MTTRQLTAYDAGKYGWLVPVRIDHQKRSHPCCQWNSAVRAWHGQAGRGPSIQQRQARLDGIIARHRGALETDNPFPLNTAHSKQWAKGYRDAGA